MRISFYICVCFCLSALPRVYVQCVCTVSVWVYANTRLGICRHAANDLELAVSWGHMKGGGWCVHVCIEDICAGLYVCAQVFVCAQYAFVHVCVQWLWSTTAGLTFEAHLPGARVKEYVDRIHIAISFSFQMYGPALCTVRKLITTSKVGHVTCPYSNICCLCVCDRGWSGLWFPSPVKSNKCT